MDRSFSQTLESVYRFDWEVGYQTTKIDDCKIEYNIALWYSQLSKEQKVDSKSISKDDHKLGKVFSGLDDNKSPISKPKISEYWDLYYPLYTQLKKIVLKWLTHYSTFRL